MVGLFSFETQWYGLHGGVVVGVGMISRELLGGLIFCILLLQMAGREYSD